MRLERFTLLGQKAIQVAGELAERNQHPEIEPEHLLLALLTQPEGFASGLLTRLKANVPAILAGAQAAIERLPKVEGVQRFLSPRISRVVDAADKLAEGRQDSFIGLDVLLQALAAEKGAAGQLLRQHGATPDALAEYIKQRPPVTNDNPEVNYESLEKYAKDLTQLARDGKLDPVIGRDEEIRRTIQVLSRRTKNNPVLIGEPGVGKTAIAELLAQRIVSGDVPETLQGKRLLTLDIGSLVAGTK